MKCDMIGCPKTATGNLNYYCVGDMMGVTGIVYCHYCEECEDSAKFALYKPRRSGRIRYITRRAAETLWAGNPSVWSIFRYKMKRNY